MHTCFTAPSLPTQEFIYEWAGRQTELSVQYRKDGIGMSKTPDGRQKKRAMMKALDAVFQNRASLDLRTDYISTYRKLFLDHLEDPGTFENFRFFFVPDSDEMIMFYLSIWTGRMGDAMLYLHRYGKNLAGLYRFAPHHESWFQMVEHEAIAQNEKIKAESVAAKIKFTGAKNICFFGGGALPERLYHRCLAGKNVKVIETDTHPKGTAHSVMRYPSQDAAPASLRIISDSLLNTKCYPELRATQDLVVMHGVSMYLGKESKNMAFALENASYALRPGGTMMFDYLLMTPGMLRTATAQHWPGAEKMLIFDNAAQAIVETNAVVNLANKKLASRFFIDSLETTTVERWGATSLRVHLVKTPG